MRTLVGVGCLDRWGFAQPHASVRASRASGEKNKNKQRTPYRIPDGPGWRGTSGQLCLASHSLHSLIILETDQQQHALPYLHLHLASRIIVEHCYVRTFWIRILRPCAFQLVISVQDHLKAEPGHSSFPLSQQPFIG
jgi:hypothetical protein